MKTYCLHNPLAPANAEVKALQVALAKDGYYHGDIDGIFGPGTALACNKAKYALGYPTDKITSCGGPMLFSFLTGVHQLPEDYKQRAAQRAQNGTENAKRAKAVQYALWGVANEPRISYHETRPMDHLHSVQTLPWDTDCSEFVTTIYCWSQLPDPNGSNYNGLGYTGDMLNHGKYVPLKEAQPADLVIWGIWPGHHVAMLIEAGSANGGNPQIVSHGSMSGPLKLHLNDETAAQNNRPLSVKSYI